MIFMLYALLESIDLETCYGWIEGYIYKVNRTFGRLLRHNKLDRHVEQTCYMQTTGRLGT